MAGTTDITKAPYPTAPDGCVVIRLGSYCADSMGAKNIAKFIVPWNCYVRQVDYDYEKIGNDLDGCSVVTVDDSKTIVASADMSGDLDGVTQTLHADVASDAYEIEKGDVIVVTADAASGESGIFCATIHLRPVYG